MRENLKEALQYAAADPIWLARPVHLLGHMKVLAAEVIELQRQVAQLQDALAVQDAQFQDERGKLKADLKLARKNTDDLEEELTHRAGERAEYHTLKERTTLLEALIEAYRAHTTEPHESIVAAQQALSRWDTE